MLKKPIRAVSILLHLIQEIFDITQFMQSKSLAILLRAYLNDEWNFFSFDIHDCFLLTVYISDLTLKMVPPSCALFLHANFCYRNFWRCPSKNCFKMLHTVFSFSKIFERTVYNILTWFIKKRINSNPFQ